MQAGVGDIEPRHVEPNLAKRQPGLAGATAEIDQR